MILIILIDAIVFCVKFITIYIQNFGFNIPSLKIVKIQNCFSIYLHCKNKANNTLYIFFCINNCFD